METSTRVLTRDEMVKLITSIVPALITEWGDTILISHGGVSDIDMELQYVQHVINTGDLVQELMHQEEIYAFVIGQNDLFIADCQNVEQIHLCHEGDIHLKISTSLHYKIKNHITSFAAQ